MIRNLKVLGLAVVAVLAMTAVAASGASAHTFTAESTPTILTGNQASVNKFAVAGATVECPVARFKGTVTGTSATSITVHPEYEGAGGKSCEVKPIGSATVNTGNCNYIITSATVGSHAPVSIECSSGDITVNGPCVIHIGAQTEGELEGGVTFVNGTENGKGDVTVTATVSGITATVTDSFLCTLGGVNPGTYGNATYNGSVTVTGYADSATGVEGAQKGISVS